MLRSVDVYVAPNTGGESFGMILTEAMAAGTPVVASDLDAFRRVLDGGRAGRAVPDRRRRRRWPRALGRAAGRPGAPGRAAGPRADGGRPATTGRCVAKRVLEVYATAIEAHRRRGSSTRSWADHVPARDWLRHDAALRCPRMWWVVGVVARRGRCSRRT